MTGYSQTSTNNLCSNSILNFLYVAVRSNSEDSTQLFHQYYNYSQKINQHQVPMLFRTAFRKSSLLVPVPVFSNLSHFFTEPGLLLASSFAVQYAIHRSERTVPSIDKVPKYSDPKFDLHYRSLCLKQQTILNSQN